MESRTFGSAVAALAAGLLLSAASPGWAQQAEERQQVQQQPAQPGQAAQPRGQRSQAQRGARDQNLKDYQIAACLISANEAEVAINQFAQQETQDADVNAFAEKMVKEHTALIEKLHGVGLGVQTNPQGQARQQAQQANPPTQQNAQRQLPNVRGVRGLNIIAVNQQINDALLPMIMQSLQNQPEKQFNEAFMTQQISAHMHMIAKLKVAQQHASPELQQVLQQATTTTEQHLEHAQQLFLQVKTPEAATAAQPAAPQRQR